MANGRTVEGARGAVNSQGKRAAFARAPPHAIITGGREGAARTRSRRC